MHSLSQLVAEGRCSGKRVLIRADLNVPQNDNLEITDDTRVRASIQAVQMSLDAGAAVMITSHLGRPTEGAFEEKFSLDPVAKRLGELLGKPVRLERDWLGGVAIEPGEVVVLENCRLNKGEKKNDSELARRMAGLCDVYVNDAFATAHRAEATTEGIGHYAPLACAGPLLAAEIEAIGKALQNPARPLTAIVGGSKVSTKLTILESLAQKVDFLVVGGGIANTFLLAAGHPIGKSLAEHDLVPQSKTIMQKLAERGANIPLPTDLVVAKEFSPQAEARIVGVNDVADDDMILDIGPNSAKALADKLSGQGTIVWNGPVGVFEIPQFANGTKLVAEAIASSPAFSIAGGGDTLAAIAAFNITKKINYISTGGGAFLEMLEGKELPAVAMLQQRAG